MSKTTKKAPPKSGGGGFKLPAEFMARVGQPRTCTSCGETKPIEHKTYASSKTSPDRVSPVCRRCQGLKAREKQLNKGKVSPSDEATIKRLSDPARYPDPTESARTARLYYEQIDEAVARLYDAALDPARDAETKALTEALTTLTRLPGDRGGGGQARDERCAFLTFTRLLKPLVVDWLEPSKVHDAILDGLLKRTDRSLILASRNSGKSTWARFYLCWLLWRDPYRIVLVLSAGASLARRIVSVIRAFIEGCPMLASIRPGDDQTDNLDGFVTPQAHGRIGANLSFSAFGITSRLTGRRASEILLDDVEARADQTAELQEQLEARVSEVWSILNPGGRVIGLGTPQVEGSLYARWNAGGEWEVTIARLFKEHEGEGVGKLPALESLWPERFSDDELEKRRRGMPARDWALHWRIDLTVTEQHTRPLKLRDFCTIEWDVKSAAFPQIVLHGGDKLDIPTGVADPDDHFVGPSFVSPETALWLTTVAAVDPASGVAGRDECGVTIVSATVQGVAVIRCIAGVRGSDANDTLNRTAALIHGFTPNRVVIEARADSLYPAQLSAVLRTRGYPIVCESVYSGQKKGERIIDSVSVPLADRRVVMLADVVRGIEAQETLKQITHITRDGRSLRHDDRIDSLAHALTAVAQLLTADPADHVNVPSQQRMEQLLRLPLRLGGITEDSLEMLLFESSEEEERDRMRLDHLLSVQREELQQGIVDPSLSETILALQRDLAKSKRF